jgi:indolepyruvate ferredoxin oxidoreductase beta subunit
MIGRILTKKGAFVTIGETFGAAQRGGDVFSSVRISNKRYYGPLTPEGEAHIIMSMEPLETLRVLRKYGNPDVASITNFQPISPVNVLAKQSKYPDPDKLKETSQALSKSSWFINATEMAMELKARIVANIIMIGALTGTKLIPITLEDIQETIRETFPPSKVDLNLEALSRGFNAVQ